MVALRALAGLAGFVVVAATLSSAMLTVVLPRGVATRLTSGVFVVTRRLFEWRVRGGSYERRDRVFAYYAQTSLAVLLATWLTLVLAGFLAGYYAIEGTGWPDVFYLSGSSLFTLGFTSPRGPVAHAVSYVEAGIGLGLAALLISYLPTLYGAFARREALVAKLEVRAGRPPTGVELLTRFWRLERLSALGDVWRDWESWFVDLEESHTSYAPLVFFRSPQPDHSWVTAAGAVLDGASLATACLDRPRDVDAQLCIRAGYLCLRRICALFALPFPTDPNPGDPISIAREEFDQAYEQLAEAGLPLRQDRDECWRAFAGWRINYDQALVQLAALTMAPYAPWSSDRSLAVVRTQIHWWRTRKRFAHRDAGDPN